MTSYRDQILHAAGVRVYDPVARRERYLRERKLLGRQPATATSGVPGHLGQPAASTTGQPATKSTPVTPARVAALHARLDELKTLLARLTEQANAKAGVKAPPPAAPAAKKAADAKKTPDKPKTAAEKKDEAKKAKEARAKAPPKPDSAASVQAQIDSVRSQIESMRAKLAAARKVVAPKTKPPSDSKSNPEDHKQPPVRQPTANDGRHH